LVISILADFTYGSYTKGIILIVCHYIFSPLFIV
jgi:hypothetical protein